MGFKKRRLRYLGLSMSLILVFVVACAGAVEEAVTSTPTSALGPTAPSGITPSEYEPPHNKPGPAVDRIYFSAFDVDRAPLELRQGAMDAYIFGLKIAAARDLSDATDVRLFEAPASMISIILNPAPAPEGQLNPFSIREVRQAFQRLVDREFIAAEIYGGRALPMTTHVSPLDFDFLTIFDQVRGSSITYEPEFAREEIRRAMTQAGAELVDGVWHYQDRPIRVKFITRVEDERRDVGNLISAELEQAGFRVERAYLPFAPAILTVYSSDPQAFQWHLYTEGWGRGSPQRYDFSSINQMAAPWLGNMPGWREVGFWQFENPELDEIGKRIFTGQFSSLEERNQLYRQATQLAIEDSVRIWVATILNSFPAVQELTGVTEDLVAGPRSIWTLRAAYVPGKEELTVGNLWVWTERTTWNPVGGFGDVYSVDIWRNMYDPPIWNHPFTGIPIPFRADFQVETAGPNGKLSVDRDAFMWDAEAGQWRTVGDGIQATSKVIFDYSKYFQSVWHHGQPITMADVLYDIFQNFDIAYNTDKARIEVALAVTSRPFLETFRGFRVLDENRLEVYLDFWHFDSNYIAAFASPASLSMPWEILAAMDTLVFEKRRAAYSDTSAGRFQVPWLSLVMKTDALLVQNTLRDLAKAGQFPEEVFTMGGSSFVSLKEAQERYEAAMSWFETNEHLMISNGPFYLADYDPPAQFAELRAFRDPTYPFKPGDWFFGTPQLLEFLEIDAETINAGSPAEIRLKVEGPGSLGVRYLLLDLAAGEVVASGEATRLSPGEFAVELDGSFTAGLTSTLYQLFLAAHSDEISQITERRINIAVQG